MESNDLILQAAATVITGLIGWLISAVRRKFIVQVENETVRGVLDDVAGVAETVVGGLYQEKVKHAKVKLGNKLDARLAQGYKAEAKEIVAKTVGISRLEKLAKLNKMPGDVVDDLVGKAVENAVRKLKSDG